MESRQRTVMGDGESRGDRIVDVAIRMAMSGNIPMSTIDGSAEPCVIDCNAEGLFLAFGKERWNASKEDLHSLWRRFEEWTVRPGQSADFAPFLKTSTAGASTEIASSGRRPRCCSLPWGW